MLESTNLLWYSTIAVQFLFCLHLIWAKLARDYRIFTAYLGYSVVRDLAAIYFMQGAVGRRLPLTYSYFWLWTEPALLLLQIALAWEVHQKMWKDHGDVLRQTRPVLVFALLAALAGAAIPLRAEALHGGASTLLLVMHFEIQSARYVSTVLAIFLILSAVLYLVAADNGQARSIVRHDGIMATYFAIYAIAAFLIGTGWVRTSLVNGYFLSAVTLCFIGWFSAFKPQPLPHEP